MRLKINWDAVGVTASFACAIHCAVLPVFLTSLPLFGVNIIDNPGFEYGMVVVALAVGCYSLYHGKNKHHHSWVPFRLFLAGMLLLILKVKWHDWQLWLLLPAVMLIITAHVLNYRFCRVHAHVDDCAH